MRVWVLLVTVLALSVSPSWAWRTKKHLIKHLKHSVGRNADDIVREWGAPAYSYTYQDGSKDLIFRRTGGISTFLPTFPATYGPRTAVTTQRYCEITLHVDKDNLVETWKYYGNNCKADPLGSTKSKPTNP